MCGDIQIKLNDLRSAVSRLGDYFVVKQVLKHCLRY